MLPLALIAALLGAGPDNCIRNDGRCNPSTGRTKGGYAWFEFAPASGAGLPSAGNLCDQLQDAEKVGNWWCLNGDGTMASGSQRTLSAAGSPTPTTQADTVCPSGPACSSKTSIRTSGSGRYELATAVTNQVSGLTACGLVSLDTTAGTQVVVGHTDGGGNFSFWCGPSSGSFSCTARNTTPTSVTTGTITIGVGEIHLLCGTYSTTDGVARVYVDGIAGTPATALSPTTLNGASLQWNVANVTSGGFPVVGRTFGAFVTDTQLDATAMGRIARAVLADAPTGVRSEAMTLTRASVQFCASSDGTGSLLPNNRPCITQGGTTAAQGAFTQSALRTEEFDNAGWVTLGSAWTVTPNAAISPAGTLTAERVQIPAVAPGVDSLRYQSAFTGGAVVHTGSVYVKGNGESGFINLIRNASTTCYTCTYNPTTWTRCVFNTGTSGNVNFSIGHSAGSLSNSCGYNSTGTGASDVFLWGANTSVGSNVRPYIPATSAAVTTANEVPYLTLTSAPALNSIEAIIDTPATYAASAAIAEVYKDASNYTRAYVKTADSNKLACNFVVGDASNEGLSAGAISANASHRLSCSYDGTNVIACVDGTCNSTARSFSNFSGATRVYLGTASATGAEINPSPVIKGVKADPSPTRFR